MNIFLLLPLLNFKKYLVPASLWGFPGDSVKNLPAVGETQVRSLVQEDPLEKGMAAHSSILAWRIPWTEELGKSDTTVWLTLSLSSL